jgi:hypothetical protein
MKNLANAVLDYYWFLNFSDEEELDPDRAIKLAESLVYEIENEWTAEEKQTLSEAAQRRLNWWLGEPDEHGYTPRKGLIAEQKTFLEALIAGHFDGDDFEDEE